jgi:hypothetical protein
MQYEVTWKIWSSFVSKKLEDVVILCFLLLVGETLEERKRRNFYISRIIIGPKDLHVGVGNHSSHFCTLIT